MKTKKLLFISIVAITFAVFLVGGCKKKDTTTNTNPVNIASTADGIQQTQKTSDQSDAENGSNQAMDDCNSAMQGVSTTRSIQTTYCNMTIDSSNGSHGTLVLTYNGNDCNNLTNRTGTITVQLPYANGHVTTWSTPGVTASLTFTNFKVTNLASNKSITYNGIHRVTNVNGGGLVQLYLGTPIVNKVRAAMQLTFSDSTTRSWNVATTRTLSSVAYSGIVKATTAGDTILAGHNHVAFWGVNRINESFTIDMPTSFSYMVYGTTCLYKPQTGVIVFYGVAHSLTLTYGVDANGNATTACPYGYKFSWVDGNGASQQIVLAY